MCSQLLHGQEQLIPQRVGVKVPARREPARPAPELAADGPLDEFAVGGAAPLASASVSWVVAGGSRGAPLGRQGLGGARSEGRRRAQDGQATASAEPSSRRRWAMTAGQPACWGVLDVGGDEPGELGLAVHVALDQVDAAGVVDGDVADRHAPVDARWRHHSAGAVRKLVASELALLAGGAHRSGLPWPVRPMGAAAVSGRLDALDDLGGVSAAAGHVVLDGADLAAAVGDRLGRRRLSASIARDASARVLGMTKLTPRWRASWRR